MEFYIYSYILEKLKADSLVLLAFFITAITVVN